jgi:hypothetical protein
MLGTAAQRALRASLSAVIAAEEEVSQEDVEPCPEVLQGVGVVSIDPINEIKSRHRDGMTYLKALRSPSEQRVLHQQELLCAVATIDAARPPILNVS